MPDSSPPQFSGQFLTAVYSIIGDARLAEKRARDICLEQTVEFPDDLIPSDDIRENVVGRLVSLAPQDTDHCLATIEFAVETVGGDLTQLLNVLFGNISIKPGISLQWFSLPGALSHRFRGPRFGQPGLRAMLGIHDRPLLCTAIKPMGLSPRELADLTYKFALGGIDLIKDDHGLSDQAFCTFDERVQRCSEAVRRANRESGRDCLYLSNITAPADQIQRRARMARDAGAGGALFCPGLAGFDAMRTIADQDDLALPLLSHPAFLGSFTAASGAGISHGALYGQINRLAGADGTIFPNYGGRFSFTEAQCREIVTGCEMPMGEIKPIFPVPAGGMSLERVSELCQFYGKDSILLIGGDLHRHGPDLVENCRKFVGLVETAFQKGTK